MNQQHVSSAIGVKVRAVRKRAGLSLRGLAAAADVSERYLHQLERGVANVSVGILAKVADALNVEFSSLLPWSNDQALDGRMPRHAHGPLADLIGGMSASEQEGAAAVLQAYLRDRRKSLRGIALLGLRGAGKSTIGGAFAQRLGLPFLSVTREVETRAGIRLSDLFNLGGPEGYRSLENEVIRDLAGRSDRIVLETAGGIVANPEALEVILASFKTVWLKTSPEEHLARVIQQGDMRPMQGTPKALDHLKTLLAAREPEYARADHVIETSGRSIEACVDELTRIAGSLARAA